MVAAPEQSRNPGLEEVVVPDAVCLWPEAGVARVSQLLPALFRYLSHFCQSHEDSLHRVFYFDYFP